MPGLSEFITKMAAGQNKDKKPVVGGGYVSEPVPGAQRSYFSRTGVEYMQPWTIKPELLYGLSPNELAEQERLKAEEQSRLAGLDAQAQAGMRLGKKNNPKITPEALKFIADQIYYPKK